MKLNYKPGFTLIEVVIVFTLLGILSFGMSVFIVEAMQGWVIVSGREESVGNARRAMDRITQELRRIKKPENILTMEAARIRFLDIDSAMITFEASGASLLRNGDILVSGLSTPEGLHFYYFGSTGEVATVKQNVRAIRVWLAVGSGLRGTTLESAARLRNI